jgi:hypothetical protein
LLGTAAALARSSWDIRALYEIPGAILRPTAAVSANLVLTKFGSDLDVGFWHDSDIKPSGHEVCSGAVNRPCEVRLEVSVVPRADLPLAVTVLRIESFWTSIGSCGAARRREDRTSLSRTATLFQWNDRASENAAPPGYSSSVWLQGAQ